MRRDGSQSASGWRGRTSVLVALLPTMVSLLGAWLYRWVDEDAFINFRIIENLLGGRGFVYNPGERVEVDSDPLWVLVLALSHLVMPFLKLEWLSVLLGLFFCIVGFMVGALAGQRLLGRRQLGLGLPVGLLGLACLPVLWEFSTSGLECSMAFAWIAISWWLLILAVDGDRLRKTAAVVMGLGGLIRPEVTLMALTFIAALLVVEMRRRGWRPSVALAAVALAIPAAAELLRAAYFGLLVPNTGLAKDAGESWWSQGLRYLGDLAGPYLLWIPACLIIVLLSLLIVGRARAQDRSGLLLIGAPLMAGLLDATYVIGVGGDYMHGRLLLPALFAICLPVLLPSSQLRSAASVAAIGLVAWGGIAALHLRVQLHPPKVLGLQTIFISDERLSWIASTGQQHPITTEDYATALSGRAGIALRRQASNLGSRPQRLDVITNPFLPVSSAARRPGHSHLPFRLAANIPGVGVVGYLAGPEVYVFDSFSLANPIGSHFTVPLHARPGHEKWVSPAWMLGRFGVAEVAPVPGSADRSDIAAARRAVGCGELARYLGDITGPWTASKAWSSLLGSPSATMLRFPAEPSQAERQLCRKR